MSEKEKFSGKKLISGFNIFSLVWWSKAITDTFKVLIVFVIVVSLTFGIGYWRGMRSKPVILGYRDFVTWINNGNDEHKIEVRDGKLYFNDRMVRVSDVPRLKPYGVHIKPKLFVGTGSNLEAEVGVGAEVAHYFKLNLDLFGTNKAFYGGISYDLEIEGWLENSSTGLAIGKGWDLEDTRLLWYWSWKF